MSRLVRQLPPAERGQKRKFELDTSEIDQMAAAAEDAALAEIQKEHEFQRKNRKLPSFWLPSLTPQAGPAKVREVKLETMCQASEHPHPLKSVPRLLRPTLSIVVAEC